MFLLHDGTLITIFLNAETQVWDVLPCSPDLVCVQWSSFNLPAICRL